MKGEFLQYNLDNIVTKLDALEVEYSGYTDDTFEVKIIRLLQDFRGGLEEVMDYINEQK